MATRKRTKSPSTTYAALQQQIAQLQQQAESLRVAEVAGVVARIREAIDVYQLTPEDLFGSVKRKTKKAAATNASADRKPSVPKYRDSATGKTWSGHGKRPGWFVAAVESGVDPATLAA